MKILLINNHTKHLKYLKQELSGHDVEMQVYKPGLDFHTAGKDLVILSGGGGEGLEIHDVYKKGKAWHDDQINFVKQTGLPVLGICMGFEVICKAYGQEVVQMPSLVEQYVDIEISDRGQQLLRRPKISQYEAQQWNVPCLEGQEVEVLGSSHRDVHIIKHSRRPVLATQFHPEKGGTFILEKFMAVITA